MHFLLCPLPSLHALECFEQPNEWAMSRALFANSWLLTAPEMSDDLKLIAYKGLITYCPKSKMVLIARCIYVETSNYVFRTDNPLSNFGPMQNFKESLHEHLIHFETMMKVISWGIYYWSDQTHVPPKRHPRNDFLQETLLFWGSSVTFAGRIDDTIWKKDITKISLLLSPERILPWGEEL